MKLKSKCTGRTIDYSGIEVDGVHYFTWDDDMCSPKVLCHWKDDESKLGKFHEYFVPVDEGLTQQTAADNIVVNETVTPA